MKVTGDWAVSGLVRTLYGLLLVSAESKGNKETLYTNN